MPKKTILFLFDREVTYLPPLMAILDSLNEDYSLKVISHEKDGGLTHLKKLYQGKDVSFISTITQENTNSLLTRVKRRLCSIFKIKGGFHKEAVSLIEKTPYDILWVAHEFAAQEFKDYLMGKSFILGFYELHDRFRDFLPDVKKVVQHARAIITPEYNRAHIIKAWYELKQTPFVIPNKPFFHPQARNIDNQFSAILKDKKIILFQGYIQRVRNIDILCEACNQMKDFNVVIMGKGDNDYIEELRAKYPSVIHIGFVQPPHHLNITSYARIGVVKYDPISLNALYCAPNKTWEYTGFGIPVLCHDLPGLHYSIEASEAGVCCDMDNVEAVKEAIQKIDNNYDYYSKKALDFYKSFDLKTTVLSILNKVTGYI